MSMGTCVEQKDSFGPIRQDFFSSHPRDYLFISAILNPNNIPQGLGSKRHLARLLEEPCSREEAGWTHRR